ncbi:methyltransferase domain-containing protein [Krasilnikovia sp. M28-CT-15]|uniref:class I SAM-dependent methyltransferase n=1 Tax=Krasilnikovia sp. M28-CT-15 TaxID=3373540 RepID=UPI003876E4B4
MSVTKSTDGYSAGMLSKDSPQERNRLEAIQGSVDAVTVDILNTIGVRPAAHCLELGAGAGSIAYWLADHCRDGRVVAMDIDTRYLDPGYSANLEVQEADVTDEGYQPGSFDLIHARYLLCHLPDRDAVLARAASWLKPGGWLVVEEPYQLPAETSPFPLVRRLMAAYARKYAQHGADLEWARSLPHVLARNGLTDLEYRGNLARMGSPGRDRWAPLIKQAGPALVADGLLTEEDLAGFFDLLADPAFVDIPQVTISAWARRPGDGTG